MPIKADYVQSQKPFLDVMARIGANEGNITIVNFLTSQRLGTDLPKMKAKLLDETDATPLGEFTNAEDIVKDANVIEEYGNAIQIFGTTVKISDKARLVVPDVKSEKNIVKKEVQDAAKELSFKVAKAILSDQTPSTTDPMRMGGLGHFVDPTNGSKTISIGTSDKLTNTAVVEQIEEAVNEICEFIASKKGAGADVFAMSPALKRAFNRFGTNVTVYKDARDNEIRDLISVYVGDFGAIHGYFDFALAGTEKGYLFRKADTYLGYLGKKDFEFTKLPKTGTYTSIMITGMLTVLTDKYSVGKIEIERT